MKLRLILFAFLLSTLTSFGQVDSLPNFEGESARNLFSKGNEAYTADQFQEAIDLYQLILDGGQESAEIYFNMGNAYFKLNDLPNAILYYEKARKLDAESTDIINNLEIANLKTIDKVESKPVLPLTDWWKSLLNSQLIDEWAMNGIYISFLSLAIMLIFLFTSGLVRKISFFLAAFIFSISVLFFFLGQQQKSQHVDSRYAIIFSPSVTVKSSPELDGTRLFVIHEGTKVELLKTEGSWTEISLMNGNRGWLQTDVFKPI